MMGVAASLPAASQLLPGPCSPHSSGQEQAEMNPCLLLPVPCCRRRALDAGLTH